MKVKYLPGEKFLMPFQNQPFNGDTFAVEKFLELKNKFGIETAIELGCCVGGTTRWLSQNFKKVIATEINPEYLNIAAFRVGYSESDVTFYEGNTVDVLQSILDTTKEQFIIFADDHWNQFNPLLRELEIIAENKLKPIIVIHDMLVPGHKEMGYDVYENIVYEWKWIAPSIEKIYGAEGYVMEYNSKATGARRGIVYVYPK